MQCPDENTFAAYVAGTLAGPTRSSVEEHVDRCAACTALVAELARVATMRPAAPEPSHLTQVAPGPNVPVSAAPPPAQMGRYVIERPLGSGAFGTVHQAYDPVLGRRVAIKVLRSAGGDDAEGASILREAQAMAQLAHPNIVPLFEVGSAPAPGGGTSAFLVMELVMGRTLRSHLEGASMRDVLRTYREVGEGLAAAHAIGVFHRDFKPENVLVGSDGRPRIADFGHALHRLRGPRRGELVGTPAYAAPEQIFGHPIDARADQFAFAVSFYEALSGQFPFPLGSLDALRWVYATRPAAQMPLRPDVPPSMVTILGRALSVQPAQRYPNMRELLLAIDRALSESDQLHVRIHAVLQCLALPLHVLAIWGIWFTDRAPGTSTTTGSAETGSSSSLGPFDVFLGSGLIVGFMFFAAWMFLGVAWAPINAWGLWTRRRFARVSTLIYGVLTGFTCIGIPYTIYAVWTFSRPGVKEMFKLGR